jgi:hypothetical protein
MSCVDPGFDFETAKAALRRWLVEHGGMPEGILPDDEALAHMGLHGVPSRVRDEKGELVDAPRCPDWPCKKSGVSFALWELNWHSAIVASPRPQIIDGLQRLAAELGRLAKEHAEPLREHVAAVAADFEKHPERISPGAVFHRHYAHLCTRPSALIEKLDKLVELSRRFVEACDRDLLGDAHCVLPSTHGGREHQDLLTAVTQHLVEGGFGFEEIAELIREGEPQGAEERVRSRARAKHVMRRVEPYDPSRKGRADSEDEREDEE